MKNSAQPTSTQAFTEIVDIRDNVVLLKNNNACLVLQITSVNFALLSRPEQDARVAAYAALLNSLSFTLQIVVRSKPIDIMPYIQSIDTIAKKTQNLKLASYIENYKDFVSSLVKMSTVLDKQFYIVIPYSGLEAGASAIFKQTTQSQDIEPFFQQAKISLETKAEGVLSQIHRLSLQAKILEKDALTKLFYDIYNQGESLPLTITDMENPMVKGIT